MPAGIDPLELIPGAAHEAEAGEDLGLVGKAEVHVHRREAVVPADLHQCRAQRFDDPAAVGAGMGEETHARRRRERRGDEQLRVVADAGALRRLGPAVVEDKLPLAVSFQVERAGADQPIAVPQGQMLLQPAGGGADAAGILQRRQPPPLEKRRPVSHEPVPDRRLDVGQAAMDAKLHVMERYCNEGGEVRLAGVSQDWGLSPRRLSGGQTRSVGLRLVERATQHPDGIAL